MKLQDIKDLTKTLNEIKDQGGLTLKGYKSKTYKSGYQVATEGVKKYTINDVLLAIDEYKGDCGIWLDKGTWYVDKSHKENSLQKALKVGKAHDQISILKWSDMSLVYC